MEVGGNPSIFVHSIIQILLLMKKILGEWNLMSSFQNFDLGVDVCKNQVKKTTEIRSALEAMTAQSILGLQFT